jgi:hypothetical protein
VTELPYFDTIQVAVVREPTDPQIVTLVETIQGDPGPPGPTGPTGPPGSGVGSLAFTLNGVPSVTLEHSFAVLPMVYVIADGQLALIGASYPDATHVHLVFPQPFTGVVVLNP